MKLDTRIISHRLVSGAIVLMQALLVFSAESEAQTIGAGAPRSGLTGHVGLSGEAYMARGIANRRDPASALIFGRASSMGAPVSYGFQFLLATEQTGSRQSMNRFSANLGYGVVRASLGDMSPVLSRYSFNGTTVRGAAIEFSPGPSIITVMGGRLRRPVDEPARASLTGPSYREMLYAARVGAGPSNGTHAHLIGIVARDSRGSIADSLDAPPRENVSFTPDVGVLLLDRRLALGATYSLAAFSADTRASRSDADVSSMLGLFTPRVGSRIDYAADVYARLRMRDFRVNMSYERIQPGFRSLGLWQTRSDQATFRVEPTVLFANRRANVSLRLASSHNNLEGNRAATLRRRSVFLMGSFRLSTTTSLAAAYSNFRSVNELDELSLSAAAADQKNVAQTFMVSPTFTLASGSAAQVINVTASYQFLRDKTASNAESPMAAEFDNLTFTAGYNIAFPGGTSLNASGGFLNSSTPITDAGALSLTVGAGRSFADRRATVGITAGWSRNSLDVQSTADNLLSSLSSTQLSARLTGTYRVPSGSVVRISVRGLRNSGSLTSSFRELQTTLTIEHRF